MKSIRTKILVSFFLAALASITALGVMITWQLTTSLSEQTTQLAAAMTSRVYQNLAYPQETFRARLYKDIRQTTDELRNSSMLRTNLESSNIKALQAEIHAAAQEHGLNFVLVCNTAGQVEASYPINIDVLKVERYLTTWDFGKTLLHVIQHDGDDIENAWETFSWLDSETLAFFGLNEWDVSGKGALSVVSAGVLNNDFDEPIGLCLVGKMLSNYGDLLKELRDTGEYASAIFWDTTLLTQSGFDRSDFELPPEIVTQVMTNDTSTHQMLEVSEQRYIASCSPLHADKADALGIVCIGIPESHVQSAIYKVTQLGQETRQHIQRGIVLIGIGALALFTLLSLIISSRLVRPITRITHFASQVAVGDLSAQLTVRSNDEIGMVADTFRELMAYIRSVAEIAQRVSAGDIDVQVTPRSQHDILNLAFAETIRYIQDVAAVTERISHKDLQVEITPKSEQDVLNIALQRMVSNLQEMMHDIEHSMASAQQLNWIRTGQTELNTRLRGEQEVAALAHQTVSYLATYLNAQLGALYLMNEDNECLALVGSYAYIQRKGNRNDIPLGSGLVGQAALEKQRILFSDIPAEYVTINSGLGQIAPKYVLITPFLYEGQVKGVIELGSLRAFTQRELDFLDQVVESVAITFHSAQSRVKMRDLLGETQRQAEELQSQQEQLTYTNKELEKQAVALQTSEEKLRVQQEELRQANEELIEKSRALEKQQQGLQEKNRELERARQELERKAKELALASQYKSEFLANMSHELRTPLNSLLILSKLLAENKEGNLDDKQVKSAETIYSAGSDLLRLINDILDLSKVESGKMTVMIEEVTISSISQYIRQHFQHITDEKGISLDIALDETLPQRLFTDRQRVEQILKNFLSNAIKFTSDGGITVKIARPEAEVTLSNRELTPEETVGISVIDTGIGIPEEKQRLIFEAFQQADGTTSRRYGGTGLGLSISRELAALLGGEVQLRSQVGAGSIFTLYLPEIHPDHHELDAEAAGHTPKNDAEKAVGTDNIRDDRHDAKPDDQFILIIEPDQQLAKNLFNLGREKGFKCLIAGDGSAGLQLADQYKPAAVMLDMQLPDISGQTVLERLKALDETGRLPVHLISTHDDIIDAQDDSEVKYLIKPITTEKLDDAFRHIEKNLSRQIKKLLVVEQDAVTRKNILLMLASEDIEISAAATGQEMLKFLDTETFDCIVMDLDVEDMAGVDLIDAIKQRIRTSHIPLIVFTGQELTRADELHLRQYVISIVVKEGRALERLMDEVSLFLHELESEWPERQKTSPRVLHDREAVLAGKSILVVDDDMRNVFALLNLLEEKEMEVLVAESGKKALEILEEQPEVDLVLMDIMMPEMDGYETMRRIRSQDRLKGLPIIALTAKAMKGDRQKCLEAGANDYLSKPIDTDKLLSLLRVWLYK